MKKLILLSWLCFNSALGLSQANQTTTTIDCCIPKKATIVETTALLPAAMSYISKSLSDFGAIGDGVFDNTTAITNAIAWSSATAEPVIILKGVYITDAVMLKSCVHFIGVDRDSCIFKKKSGNSCNMFNTPQNSRLSNIRFDSLTIDGGVRYSNHIVDPSSTVNDTQGNMVNLANSENVSFYNVHFTGTENVLQLYNNDRVFIERCITDQIGGNVIATNYVQNITNIFIKENKFLSFGCRDKLDPVYTNQYRFGEAAFSAGGSDWTISDNFFFNGANTKWAWMEGRFTRNVTVRNNVFDGNGKNCFGVTIAGGFDINQTMLENVSFIDNVFQNIKPETSNDEYVNGVAKYTFTHYYEFIKVKNSLISGNTMPNCTVQLSAMQNVVFENNTLLSLNLTGQQVIRIGGNSSFLEDTVRNVIIRNNIINVGSGFQFLINFHQNTSVLRNVSIEGNTLGSSGICYISLSKLQDPEARIQDIRIINNNFIMPVFTTFLLESNTVSKLQIEGNNLINVNLTKARSFTSLPTVYQLGNTDLTIQNNSYINADDIPLGFSLNSYAVGKALIGPFNGVNKVFALPVIPYSGKATIVLNGKMQIRGTDYAISGTNVTFAIAPKTGDILTSAYLKP